MEAIFVTQGDPTRRLSEAQVAMLDALFTQSPLGLRLLDTDLRVVQVDAATKHGVAGEDLVGRPFPDSVRGPADPEELARIVRRVLDSGVPVQGHVVWGRLPADPGRERAYEVSAVRLHDPRGQVLGVALMGFEVTDREKAGARVGVIGAVRERVGRTLDVMVTCRDLADTLVPGFADIAVVEVVDSMARGDDPRSLRCRLTCRCAVSPSVAAPTAIHRRRIRWGTCAACRRRPHTRRHCRICALGWSPCIRVCRGWRPTRPARTRSTRPAPILFLRGH